MKKEKVVQLLQYRRHDLVNDIQVIHAYAQMNRLEKVQEKLDAFSQATAHEQKLHMVEAPSFILWLELFRMDYKIFTLSYAVQDVFNLSNFDEWMTKQCEKLMEEVQKHVTNDHLYNLHVNIYKDADQGCIELRIGSIDEFLYERLQPFILQNEQARVACTYEEEQLVCLIQIDGLIEGE